jgi:hypothetical protein
MPSGDHVHLLPGRVSGRGRGTVRDVRSRSCRGPRGPRRSVGRRIRGDWATVARIYRALATLAERLEERDPGARGRVIERAEAALAGQTMGAASGDADLPDLLDAAGGPLEDDWRGPLLS